MKNIVLSQVLSASRKFNFKTKNVVNSLIAGSYRSIFKGQGIEFEDVRPFQNGDDIRAIDWNVTSRMATPYIKLFQEERELQVMLAIDISSSSAYGIGRRSKYNLISEIAALIAISALDNKDKVGCTLYTNTVHEYLPPNKSPKHILRVLETISHPIHINQPTDLKDTLKSLSKILTKRGICFILSDFVCSDFVKQLGALAKHQDIIGIMINDPSEFDLPNAGIIEVQDPETKESMLIDTSDEATRKLFKERKIAQCKQIQETFKKAKCDLISIKTNEDYIVVIESYFKKRLKST